MCSFCRGDYEDPAVTQEPEAEVEPALCDNCDHEVSLHDSKYGCQHDRMVEADGIEQNGPCGCTAVTAEREQAFSLLQNVRASNANTRFLLDQI